MRPRLSDSARGTQVVNLEQEISRDWKIGGAWNRSRIGAITSLDRLDPPLVPGLAFDWGGHPAVARSWVFL